MEGKRIKSFASKESSKEIKNVWNMASSQNLNSNKPQFTTVDILITLCVSLLSFIIYAPSAWDKTLSYCCKFYLD